MFKKAKRKIVLSILAILCAVLVGTLGMIYLASFLSVTLNNFEILEKRTEMLTNNTPIEQKGIMGDKKPDDFGIMGEDMHGPDKMERNLQIGTFYAVKFSSSGETVVIENGADGLYSDDDLISIAESVREKEKGRTGELLYIVTNNGGETVVSFMDNTVFTDSFSMLFWFTVLFGIIAIIVITFISVYIANRIVSPMEET